MQNYHDVSPEYSGQFERAARLISQADGLVITAGAGLGVDSGLPDFRGRQGLWKAYPALAEARVEFAQIANPRAFEEVPGLAWGFYGHRLKLYRETPPGESYAILRALAEQVPDGARVFTSNVDGHFLWAGFEAGDVVECHGSIHALQCLSGCGEPVWPADEFLPEVDARTGRLAGSLPRCPACGGLARPNLLMFDDHDWIDTTHRKRLSGLYDWKGKVERLLVLEIGAGMAIPTVRRFSESLDAPIIRINLDDAQTESGRGVSLPLSGLVALRGIVAALDRHTSGGG